MTSEAQFAAATLADDLLVDDERVAGAADIALEVERRTVIAFVGMTFEAKIAAGPGVTVFSRGARREVAMAVASAARQGYRGIISFGVAGGLASGLRAGDWVVASSVVESQIERPTDAAWSNRLVAAINRATYAPIMGVDRPVAEPAQKRALHRATGAVAVDMESHVVAQLAAAHGLAFTALRVIVDPAERIIPSAALRGMGPDGRTNGIAVVRDLMVRPSQLPLLLRVGLDAFIARTAMLRIRRLLGPHFGIVEVAPASAVAVLARA